MGFELDKLEVQGREERYAVSQKLRYFDPSRIRALVDSVVIYPTMQMEVSAGGIVVPETAKDRELGYGRVISSGIEGIKEGDVVFYEPRMGYGFFVSRNKCEKVLLKYLSVDELRGFFSMV